MGARGLTLPVTSRVGSRLFEPFSVDLVVELAVTGPSDEVGPLQPIELDGMVKTPYRGYPIADQIADKHCAIIERHGAHGELPSTRYRDLVDLLLIATTQPVDATRRRAALHSEYERRGLEPPRQFEVPSVGEWEAGYRRAANDAPRLATRSLDEAVTVVARPIDPILRDRTAGTWHPTDQTGSDPRP